MNIIGQGNVRELSNSLERFVLLGDDEELIQLAANRQFHSDNSDIDMPNVEFPDSGYSWEQFERFCLKQALETNNGNKTKAANFLRMSYKAFLYRLEKYQLN